MSTLTAPSSSQRMGTRTRLATTHCRRQWATRWRGTVAKVGPGVTQFKVGDKVVVEPTGTCRDRYRWPTSPNVDKEWCAACKRGLYNICSYLGLCGAGVQSGGFAERVVINESHCYKVPEFVPLDVAALIQPLAVCWHAISVCDFKAGSTALIIVPAPSAWARF